MSELFFVKDEIRMVLKSHDDFSTDKGLTTILTYLHENGILWLQCTFLLVEYGNMPFQTANKYVTKFKAELQG